MLTDAGAVPQVLVATDVAARGLDIPEVSLGGGRGFEKEKVRG